MTSATIQHYIPANMVVDAAQYHCGRAETYRAQIKNLEKCITRQRRRINRQKRTELENASLKRELKKARALLDINGVEWK